MEQLVSVVIPCYNAERWVGEAIQSCLDQTYSPIEVIVIDDGSTDRSLDVISSFGQRIRWETGPNRGGNHARNRGFALSTGDYLQFLDADDYLLPSKIERQMAAFRETSAAVLYEDWQRVEETTKGDWRWLPIEVSGNQSDILEALLGGWATPPCALLFTRRAVELAGGWNEELTSAQDWELNIRIALAGNVYGYVPGCQSAYRRPLGPTVSTNRLNNIHENIIRVLRATEAKLDESGRLYANYKHAMARSYFRMARCYFDEDLTRFDALLQEAQRLAPSFTERESGHYRIVAELLGIQTAERLSSLKRRWLKRN